MAEIPDDPPIFLYRIIWEEIGDEPVRFENLEDRRGELKILAEINVGLGLGVRIVDRYQLEALVSALNVNDAARARLLDRLELVVGWYLEPLYRRALGQDVKSARRLLGRVARDAARLSLSLDEIDPRTAALLHFLLPLEPDARAPQEPLNLFHLGKRVHDLALVTRRAAKDIPISAGRPPDYVRNSALMLAMRAVTEATGESVTVSRGTAHRQEPHFTNPGGWLVRDLFAEVGLNHETILAQAIERMRRTRKP